MKQFRDSKGRFLPKVPLGSLCLLTRTNKDDGRPYCFNGWYIIVGLAKNGNVIAVPYTSAITKAHVSTFSFHKNSPERMDVDCIDIKSADTIKAVARQLREHVKYDKQHPAYHPGAIHCADLIDLALSKARY